MTMSDDGRRLRQSLNHRQWSQSPLQRRRRIIEGSDCVCALRDETRTAGRRTATSQPYRETACFDVRDRSSPQSSQYYVQSKWKSVQSKMGKRAVQLLAYLHLKWPLKWGITHSGDFHFQLCPVIFSDLWYDQGSGEISSITRTLQSREIGEMTMAKMRLRPGTPPPHTLPHSTPSASWSSRLQRSLLGLSVRPCCAVQKILKLYYDPARATCMYIWI